MKQEPGLTIGPGVGGQTLVASMEALASVPASTFTQAASTQGSTFFGTSTVASMGGPIMSQSQSQTECQLPNSSTAIISSMAGSTTIHNNNNKVDAATTAVRIRVTIKEMVAAKKLAAAAAAGREL